LRRRPGIRCHLIEERHGEIAQVNDFNLHIVTLGGNITEPLCRLVTEAGGTCGADDDRDLEFAHGSLYLVVTNSYQA
jgi:hypothetical protein